MLFSAKLCAGCSDEWCNLNVQLKQSSPHDRREEWIMCLHLSHEIYHQPAASDCHVPKSQLRDLGASHTLSTTCKLSDNDPLKLTFAFAMLLAPRSGRAGLAHAPGSSLHHLPKPVTLNRSLRLSISSMLELVRHG